MQSFGEVAERRIKDNNPITSTQVIDVFNNPITSIINNESTTTPDSKAVQQARTTAIYLMDKLKAPAGSAKFYLKVAWTIPRGRLDWMVATALERGSNPGAYFNALAKREMGQ